VKKTLRSSETSGAIVTFGGVSGPEKQRQTLSPASQAAEAGWRFAEESLCFLQERQVAQVQVVPGPFEPAQQLQVPVAELELVRRQFLSRE
jgi:hypothetical protein